MNVNKNKDRIEREIYLLKFRRQNIFWYLDKCKFGIKISHPNDYIRHLENEMDVIDDTVKLLEDILIDKDEINNFTSEPNKNNIGKLHYDPELEEVSLGLQLGKKDSCDNISKCCSKCHNDNKTASCKDDNVEMANNEIRLTLDNELKEFIRDEIRSALKPIHKKLNKIGSEIHNYYTDRKYQ